MQRDATNKTIISKTFIRIHIHKLPNYKRTFRSEKYSISLLQIDRTFPVQEVILEKRSMSNCYIIFRIQYTILHMANYYLYIIEVNIIILCAIHTEDDSTHEQRVNILNAFIKGHRK